MASSKISFSISGDPTPGYKTLLVGGKPTDYKDGDLKFDQNAGICKETFVAILGEKNYDYCLIMRPDIISSCRSSRGGALNIVLTIPSGKCIIDDEGKEISPATVLSSIRDHFADLFMEKDGSTLKYSTTEVDINPKEEEFCAWLNDTYKLKDSNLPVIEMNPYKPEARMVNNMDKIEELFLDLAYPELKGYSKLIAVTDGSKEGCCLNLEIPRPKSYKITVNYEYNGRTYNSSNKEELDKNGSLELSNENKFPYADFNPKSVTLVQIREASKERNSGITINDEKREATVLVKVTDKKYPITVICKDEKGEDCADLLKFITLKCGYETISFDKEKQKFIAEGKQISKTWTPQIDPLSGYKIKSTNQNNSTNEKATFEVKLQKLQTQEVEFKLNIDGREASKLPIDLELDSNGTKKKLKYGKTPLSFVFTEDERDWEWTISTQKHSGYNIKSKCDKFTPSDYKKSPFVIELTSPNNFKPSEDTGKSKDKYIFETPKDIPDNESLFVAFRKECPYNDRLEVKTIKIEAQRKSNNTFELELEDGYDLHSVARGEIEEGSWKIHKLQDYDWETPQRDYKNPQRDYNKVYRCQLSPRKDKNKLKWLLLLTLAILSIFAIGFLSGRYHNHGNVDSGNDANDPILVNNGPATNQGSTGINPDTSVIRDTIHDTIYVPIVEEQNNNNQSENKDLPSLDTQVTKFLKEIKTKVENNESKTSLAQFVIEGAHNLAQQCKNDFRLKNGLQLLYLAKSGRLLTEDEIQVICNKFKNTAPTIKNLKDQAFGKF